MAATETCAHDQSTYPSTKLIRDWRSAAATRSRPVRVRRSRWEVHGVSSATGVRLYVRRGETARLIGEADPLTDMDAFMDLRVKAENAAETLNALKLEAR